MKSEPKIKKETNEKDMGEDNKEPKLIPEIKS
jgi:hypothetical protein